MQSLLRPLVFLSLLMGGVSAWAQTPEPDDDPPTTAPTPAGSATPPPATPDTTAAAEPPVPDDSQGDGQASPHVTVDFHIDGLSEPELTNAYNWLGYVAEDQRGRLDYRRLKVMHDNAAKSIAQALEPYGYYEPTVESHLEGGPVDYFAHYQVNPGPAVRWAPPQITVSGEGAALAATITALAPHSGRRIRHAEYEAFKTSALNTLREAGYLDARTVSSELRVDVAKHTAVAAIAFESGRHWRFGPVRFSGSKKVLEEVLRRYVTIETGNSFAPSQLLATQFALTDLDYYSQVEVTPLRNEAVDDEIPVSIKLTNNKARRDDYGIGYGTDTGPRVTAGTEFRRLNSNGDKLRLGVRASQKISGASGEYRIPFGNVPAEFLSFSGSVEQDDLAYGQSRDYRLGTAFNRTIGSWKRVYYLRLHRSIFNFTAGESATVSVLTPGLSLSRQWLDDPAYARRGLSVFLDTHGGQEGLLSDATFLQGRLLVKGALGLGKDARVLGRVELAATAAENFQRLPPDERFFAGGDQSVRGYSYQSIGASQDSSGVVGGRYLNVFSVEAEHTVKGPWGVAVFVDAGGVGDTPNPTLNFGAGLGARYCAPFGSVQIDLAHPFKPGETAVRLHIGVRVGL